MMKGVKKDYGLSNEEEKEEYLNKKHSLPSKNQELTKIKVTKFLLTVDEKSLYSSCMVEKESYYTRNEREHLFLQIKKFK